MTTPGNSSISTDLANQIRAAADWWNAAGVDYDYHDNATDWLAPSLDILDDQTKGRNPSVEPKTTPPLPAIKKISGDRNAWPGDLSAFREWWMGNEAWDDAGSYPVIPSRGTRTPELMIVVAEPEEQDRDTLMSGPQGALLANMLRAMGLDDKKTYYAATLRRHTPMPDWTNLKNAGLGELLTHHVGLVFPQRILTFGRSIPPLLGNDTAQGAPFSYDIAHEEKRIPTMSAGSLPELLRSAKRRQKFWYNWLDWMED